MGDKTTKNKSERREKDLILNVQRVKLNSCRAVKKITYTASGLFYFFSWSFTVLLANTMAFVVWAADSR